MKLLPIHCSWGAPFSEKRPKLQVTDYITKKVDFRNNGFRAKMRHVWRLASWGMAFLLKQVCSRTTFVYHKKFEWERYKTYPVVVKKKFDTKLFCFKIRNSNFFLYPPVGTIKKGPNFRKSQNQKILRDGRSEILMQPFSHYHAVPNGQHSSKVRTVIGRLLAHLWRALAQLHKVFNHTR